MQEKCIKKKKTLSFCKCVPIHQCSLTDKVVTTSISCSVSERMTIIQSLHFSLFKANLCMVP